MGSWDHKNVQVWVWRMPTFQNNRILGSSVNRYLWFYFFHLTKSLPPCWALAILVFINPSRKQKHVRDLDVTRFNDATFNEHITDRCDIVKSKISWILRTFHSRHQLPMITLWKSLVLCHWDYCSQLWSPSNVGNIQSLELLQKAFVNRIEGMSCLNYWEQLRALWLQSLERRRERFKII